MKIKLDENFGTRTQSVFRAKGHDVSTVREQSLQGATDRRLYDVCKTEGRCLVTLDLDFSDVIRFPPRSSAGIVVFRLSRNSSLVVLETMARQFLQAIEHTQITGHLWIVEMGRIRIHQSNDDDW